jgi:hypothetical protein
VARKERALGVLSDQRSSQQRETTSLIPPAVVLRQTAYLFAVLDQGAVPIGLESIVDHTRSISLASSWLVSDLRLGLLPRNFALQYPVLISISSLRVGETKDAQQRIFRPGDSRSRSY